MEIINANIAELREERGWSRRELSAAMQEHGCEIGETALRRIESGQREVRLTEALSFAEVFDIPLDVIAKEQPNKDQVALTGALNLVSKYQYEVLFSINNLVRAIARLNRTRGEILEKDPKAMPDLLSHAGTVIGNTERYFPELESAYKSMLELALNSTERNKYVGLGSSFEEVVQRDLRVEELAKEHFSAISLLRNQAAHGEG